MYKPFIAIVIIYWINRRKFYRRNVADLERFSSFETSVFIRFLERLAKWLAYSLILSSVLLFLLYNSEKKRLEKNMKVRKLKKSSLFNKYITQCNTRHLFYLHI